MGYHIKEITKGHIGEFSKIAEEYAELADAYFQNNDILMLVELSDLVGAIDLFVKRNYNLTIMDVVAFSNLTQSAFQDGSRQ